MHNVPPRLKYVQSIRVEMFFFYLVHVSKFCLGVASSILVWFVLYARLQAIFLAVLTWHFLHLATEMKAVASARLANSDRPLAHGKCSECSAPLLPHSTPLDVKLDAFLPYFFGQSLK